MTPEEGDLTEIRQQVEGLTALQRQSLLDWLRDRVVADRELARQAAAAARLRAVRKPATLRRAVLWSLASIMLFFAADAALFRWGWYTKYLEPNSTTGQLELHLFWLRHSPPDAKPAVAVLGDSRIAEGFSARRAAEEAHGRITFWNLGVPGSSPRTWYYLLRDADPDHKRFAAVALAIDHYSDWDDVEDARNRAVDLNYLAGRLRLSDCFEFAMSFSGISLRHSNFAGCLFRGIPFRRDVQDFLADPDKRLDLAKDWRNHGHGYIDGYGGKPESLTGLSVDWVKRTIAFPSGTLDWQSGSARATLLPMSVPQSGALTAYRRQWLGKILDLYENSPTRIVFFELPRAPLPVPESPVPATFVESVRQRPHVTILPAETFRDLEHPEVFADGLHLNYVGRPIFSARLGGKLAAIMEGR